MVCVCIQRSEGNTRGKVAEEAEEEDEEDDEMRVVEFTPLQLHARLIAGM